MPRRKIKKKTERPETGKLVDQGPLGYNPFRDLKSLKIEQPEPEPPPPPPPVKPPVQRDDTDLFRAAMTDVTPLTGKTGRVGVKSTRPRPAPDFFSEDLAVLSQLQDLVTGRAQFDIVDTDEYVEGYVRGMHPIVLEKLRGGKFSVQAHLDLHGLTLKEAEEAVGAFIAEAETLNYTCVLLVHGRGLNSKDQIPILKQKLEKLLLRRGAVRKRILAFTTARPHDGGAGASYVLLRAKRK
jgi:DNA-nicking Smr family endonuclease